MQDVDHAESGDENIPRSKEEDCIFATRDQPEPALDMIGAGVDKPPNTIHAPLSVTEISQAKFNQKDDI